MPERMAGKRECLVLFGRRKVCDLWQLVWGSHEFSVPLSFQGQLGDALQTSIIHLQKHLREINVFFEFFFLYRFGLFGAIVSPLTVSQPFDNTSGEKRQYDWHFLHGPPCSFVRLRVSMHVLCNVAQTSSYSSRLIASDVLVPVFFLRSGTNYVQVFSLLIFVPHFREKSMYDLVNAYHILETC